MAIAGSIRLSQFGLDLLRRTALPISTPLVISWPAIGMLTGMFLTLAVLASVGPETWIGAMTIRTAIAFE